MYVLPFGSVQGTGLFEVAQQFVDEEGVALGETLEMAGQPGLIGGGQMVLCAHQGADRHVSDFHSCADYRRAQLEVAGVPAIVNGLTS